MPAVFRRPALLTGDGVRVDDVDRVGERLDGRALELGRGGGLKVLRAWYMPTLFSRAASSRDGPKVLRYFPEFP